jgi:hypothetical protein
MSNYLLWADILLVRKELARCAGVNLMQGQRVLDIVQINAESEEDTHQNEKG